ncbi:MAG: hypothetical protein GY906_36685, partial [bacterium]|nr:hypothetical protein [bacterium]
WFVAGAVLPALAYEGYFLIVGALSTQLEQSIVLPLLFMKGSFRGWVLSALHLVRVWQKGAGAYNLLIWVLFVASFIQTWIPVIQSPKRLTEFFRSRSCWAAIYVCAAVGLVFTYYDHQGFSDFYLVLPCIIVIAAATLDQLVRRLERVSVGLAWLALTLSMAAFLLPNLELMPRLQRDFTVSEQLEVANVVGQMIDSGESVWAIGCTHLLAFNQVDNWSAFGSCFRWSRAFVEYKTGKDRLSPEKDGSWPGVVLISRRFPYGSDVWLAQHYDEVTTKDFKRQGLQVFRLRSGSSVSKEDFSAPRKSPPAL